MAAVTDDYASGRAAGLSPGKHLLCRKAGGLNPACCNDGVTDKAMTVVHKEDERDVLSTAVQQLAGEPCCSGRIVDSTWDVKVALLERLGMTCCPGSGSQGSEEGLDLGCDGHGGDLREKWIHGGTPIPWARAEARTARRSHGWRLEPTRPGEYRSRNGANDEATVSP